MQPIDKHSEFYEKCLAEINKGNFPFSVSIEQVSEYTYTTIRVKLQSMYHIEYNSGLMIINTQSNKVSELLHAQLLAIIKPEFYKKCLAEINKGGFPLSVNIEQVNEHAYATSRIKLQSMYHIEYNSDLMIVNTRANKTLELLHAQLLIGCVIKKIEK